ncbi:MAG: YjbQ family protein [Firmicutes bacterium]|jgi:secondary thiamine-phosphate synthase enzyme|nr:YjbQ family protein [Bacillota bacterium]
MFRIKTTRPQEFIEITGRIEEVVREQGVVSGMVTVFVPHTTAGITINENGDPDVVHDILTSLENAFPEKGNYRHFEGNSHAHIKASLMGSSITVLVENGRLKLGTWQGLYLCEFDGPRTRTIYVKAISD